MTAMGLDTDTIEHLDFDESLPCESIAGNHEPNCPFGPAEATLRVETERHCSSGTNVRLLCKKCHERRKNAKMHCVNCGELHAYKIISVVPIKS